MHVAGLCIFQEQPGSVEGLLGEQLRIPCVLTDEVYSGDIEWRAGKRNESRVHHIVRDGGLLLPFRRTYAMEKGPRDYSLTILTLSEDGSQYQCVADGTESEWSNISALGKACVFTELLLFITFGFHRFCLGQKQSFSLNSRSSWLKWLQNLLTI